MRPRLKNLTVDKKWDQALNKILKHSAPTKMARYDFSLGCTQFENYAPERKETLIFPGVIVHSLPSLTLELPQHRRLLSRVPNSHYFNLYWKNGRHVNRDKNPELQFMLQANRFGLGPHYSKSKRRTQVANSILPSPRRRGDTTPLGTQTSTNMTP